MKLDTRRGTSSTLARKQLHMHHVFVNYIQNVNDHMRMEPLSHQKKHF